MNYPTTGEVVPGRAFGIWSFVLSFFFQLLSLIFGIIGLVQSRNAGLKNPFAVAGIVISSVVIVAALITTIVIAASGGFALMQQYR